MSKKIVILNGSPRRNGNTSTLVQSVYGRSGKRRKHRDRVLLDGMDNSRCKGCFGRSQQPGMSMRPEG